MSINNANYLLSPCELIRQLNDLFQKDTPFDDQMRYKLAMIEQMTKEMSIALYKYEPKYHKIWKGNPTFRKDKELRISKNYKFYDYKNPPR